VLASSLQELTLRLARRARNRHHQKSRSRPEDYSADSFGLAPLVVPLWAQVALPGPQFFDASSGPLLLVEVQVLRLRRRPLGADHEHSLLAASFSWRVDVAEAARLCPT
jgi:hypothetical protein